MNLSINDAAALLIQIEPDDVSELANLQELLTAIAEDKEHSEPFREKIVQAVQLIGEIIDSSVSDPHSSLTEVGNIIESAMNIMDENVLKPPEAHVSDQAEDMNNESTDDRFVDSEIRLPSDPAPEDMNNESTDDRFVDSEIRLPSDSAPETAEAESADDGFVDSEIRLPSDSVPETAETEIADDGFVDSEIRLPSDPVPETAETEIADDGFVDSEIRLPSDPAPEENDDDFVDSEIHLPDHMSEKIENNSAHSESQSPSYLPEGADPDLIGAFITESNDLIANAEEALLLLESDPDDMDAVSTVFRAFHTVKGTSAFLELSLVSEIAHHAESLLSRIRDREIRYEGAYPDLALRSIDILKELLGSVQEALEGKPLFKPRDYNELMHILSNPEKADAEPVSVLPEPVTADVPPEESIEEEEIREQKAEQEIEIEAEEDFEEEPEEEFAEEFEADEPPMIQAEKPVTREIPEPAPVSRDEALQRKQPRAEVAKQIAESSVRVPVERLDRFIDMVGELVVAHSMVAQDEIIVNGSHHELMKKVTQTGKIVRELQSMSMSMRMIPLKATFLKMARLVRDLARKAGKNVSFLTDGEDTEIDRNMVDVINDPLVHMVRNAVDHGIEPPNIRKQTGKPSSGIVQISACHSAGNVVVEIKDDGRGLDREAILAKAVERGLISSDSDIGSDRDNMPGDQDVFSLIFEPGFSTSNIISDISGRGVGMDVVKTNIEKLRGQIDIQSRPGEGTVFKISLPLTLAIIDGMVLRVGSERYVMPTASIVRSVQPDSEDISTVVRRGEMLSLQGKLIPLFRLSRLFQIEDAEDDLTKAIIMVVEDDGRQAGLVIDELIGTQQIVIKTLGEMMRNIVGISGSAIMPDGRVGLILDVGGLVKLANRD
ncbi:MAG: chemotaxis protein CheA [Desulfobacterales bacterium]|nr:chemotaxis protein CheA [Desulfobacterales bacterium]